MGWFPIVKSAKGSRSVSVREKTPNFYEEQVTGSFS